MKNTHFFILLSSLLLSSCKQESLPEVKSISAKQMLEKNAMWENEQKIKVLFLEDDEDKIKLFIKATKNWQRYANLNFEYHKIVKNRTFLPLKFLRNTIRVAFNEKIDSFSALGKKGYDAGYIHHTFMNIASSLKNKEAFQGTVTHEIGHALGLRHEHQHPDSVHGVLEKDLEQKCSTSFRSSRKMFKELGKLTEHELMICRHNLMNLTDEEVIKKGIKVSSYDDKSIMHYNLTNNPFTSKMGFFINSLSLHDKIFIADTYPMSPPLTKEEIEEMHEQDNINTIISLENIYNTQNCELDYRDGKLSVINLKHNLKLKVPNIENIKMQTDYCEVLSGF